MINNKTEYTIDFKKDDSISKNYIKYLKESKKGDPNLWSQTNIVKKKVNSSWWLDKNFEIKRFTESCNLLGGHMCTRYDNPMDYDKYAHPMTKNDKNKKFKEDYDKFKELTKNSESIRENILKSMHKHANV